MIAILDECRRVLHEAGLLSTILDTASKICSFEGETVLGFLFIYDLSSELISSWEADLKKVILDNQEGLRLARTKAWNTYSVFIAGTSLSDGDLVILSQIEEDLTGTRKIARAGISNIEDIRSALLPLLPIQNAPRLEGINMIDEIRLRTTELPDRVIEAFFSTIPEAALQTVLEESQ